MTPNHNVAMRVIIVAAAAIVLETLNVPDIKVVIAISAEPIVPGINDNMPINIEIK